MAGTTAFAPLVHAGAGRGNLSTARPPMPQPATASPIGSTPSSPLEVETVGNRDDPGLSGNDACHRQRDEPAGQSVLTGIRKKMRDGCGKARLYFIEEAATIPLRSAHRGH